jgi:hypothetical protein
MSAMEPEIIKAMPRSLAFRWVAFYATAGLAIIALGEWFLFPGIREYLYVSDKALALYRFKVVMVGMGVSLLPVVAYFLWLASRIIKSAQFPHPGAKVFHDTRVVRGRMAIVRGWVLALCALFLLGCAIYAAYLPFWMFDANG